MDKKNSIKIYKYILEKMNGYTKKEIHNLEYYEFEHDPIYKGLCDLELD